MPVTRNEPASLHPNLVHKRKFVADIRDVIGHPKTTRLAQMPLNRLNLVDKDYGLKNAINRT